MTLRLELDPAVESGLLAQAQALGLSLEAYAQKLLEEHSIRKRSANAQASEKIRAFEEFLEGLESPAVLSEDAFHRENWYPDRW